MWGTSSRGQLTSAAPGGADLLIAPDTNVTVDPFESRHLARADGAQCGYHLGRTRRVAHLVGADDLARARNRLDARRDVHCLAEIVEALVQVHRDARPGVKADLELEVCN